MERISFKMVGIVLAAISFLLITLNAIPWATKIEVNQIRVDLNEWYAATQQRISRLEEKRDRQNREINKKLDLLLNRD